MRLTVLLNAGLVAWPQRSPVLLSGLILAAAKETPRA